MKHGTKGMTKRSSAPQNTATGSGSRPGGGRFPIATSAPKDAKNLGGRGNVPGKLK